MTVAVVDASALVEYLMGSARGAALTSIVEDPSTDLHTPALCDIEVVSALRGLISARKLRIARALEAVQDYTDLPVTRHSHLPMLARLLELRDNFSAYDAAYVALAEALSARLVTCDMPLAKAAKSVLPSLTLVAIDGN